MKRKISFIAMPIIGLSLAVTNHLVFAQGFYNTEAAPAPISNPNQQAPQSASPTGESRATIVDSGGNLKGVSQGESSGSTVTPVNPMGSTGPATMQSPKAASLGAELPQPPKANQSQQQPQQQPMQTPTTPSNDSSSMMNRGK